MYLQEGYERIRILSYPQTDIFILCYSTVVPSSMYNIEERWVPELRVSCGPDVPILLVATQIDLRTDPGTLSMLSEMNEKVVSKKEGESLARKIGAVGYIECSSLTREGLADVFEATIQAVVNPPMNNRRHSCFSGLICCI